MIFKKVLFSHSYFLRFDPKQWETGLPYPPLGTLYAAALLRQHGYIVSLFDTMFAHSPEELIPYVDKIDPDVLVIYDDGFNYLTKMCLTNMREAAFEMCRLAKARNCMVIVSSSDATDHAEKYLAAGADVVLPGEAELTLLELMEAVNKGEKDWSQIPGLIYYRDEVLINTSKRPVMRNLDTLPLPAWELLHIAPYRESWLKNAGYFSINMATTRGCPFKCNWCAKPIYGNRYHSRTPQHVIQEIKLLQDLFHFDHIWFCDDIFGLKPGWVQEFAQLLEAERITIRFKIQTRADLLMQENYVEALARAGCETAWMGAESGSQKILDAMDKGTTVEQIYASTRLLKKHGIRPSFFIQFGYPGENKEDIQRTIRMIRELLPHEIGISVSYPLPGTVFYERVKDELKEKANWTDSDEMKLMFHNTYPPAFYKKLHRYVHREFTKRQGWAAFTTMLKNPLSLRMAALKKIILACLYVPGSFVERLQLKRLAHE